MDAKREREAFLEETPRLISDWCLLFFPSRQTDFSALNLSATCSVTLKIIVFAYSFFSRSMSSPQLIAVCCFMCFTRRLQWFSTIAGKRCTSHDCKFIFQISVTFPDRCITFTHLMGCLRLRALGRMLIAIIAGRYYTKLCLDKLLSSPVPNVLLTAKIFPFCFTIMFITSQSAHNMISASWCGRRRRGGNEKLLQAYCVYLLGPKRKRERRKH